MGILTNMNDNHSLSQERNILDEFTFKYGVGVKAESNEFRPFGWINESTNYDEPKELNFDGDYR